MITIGLYSDIGGGKTFIAGLFAKYDAKVINADKEVARLLQKDEIIRQIREHFPDAVDHGAVNKQYLADRVFADRKKLNELEAIIHPPVKDIIWEQYHHALKDDTKLLVLDIPLLYDSEFEEVCDVRIFIDTTPEVRFNRLLTKRGLRKSEIMRREKLQPARDKKKQKADFIITNSDDLAHAEEQVKKLINKIFDK